MRHCCGSSLIWGVTEWDTSSELCAAAQPPWRKGGSTVGLGKFIPSISLCLPIVHSNPSSRLGVHGERGKDFSPCSSSSSPAQ